MRSPRAAGRGRRSASGCVWGWVCVLGLANPRPDLSLSLPSRGAHNASMLKLGPLRLHWSLLLGAALFTALQLHPLLLLGYASVLFVHVAGHALAVAGTRLSVNGVMLHALGGELVGEGEVTPLRRSLIALSGVLAQLALLAGAALAVRHLP